jgi:hypothetical protein
MSQDFVTPFTVKIGGSANARSASAAVQRQERVTHRIHRDGGAATPLRKGGIHMSKRSAARRRIQIIPHWLDEPNAGLFAQAIVEMARQRRQTPKQPVEVVQHEEADDEPSR